MDYRKGSAMMWTVQHSLRLASAALTILLAFSVRAQQSQPVPSTSDRYPAGAQNRPEPGGLPSPSTGRMRLPMAAPRAVAPRARESWRAIPRVARSHEESAELNSKELKELQRLVSRCGYKVVIDGKFGDRSEGALKKCQKRKGLLADGKATRDGLAKLRRSVK